MLDHPQVVVRRAAAKDEVLRARPEVGNVDFRVQLLGLIQPTDPPARLLARGERQLLTLLPVEGPDARDLHLALKRLTVGRERRRPLRRKTHLVDRLNLEPVVGGANGRFAADDDLADFVVRHVHKLKTPS